MIMCIMVTWRVTAVLHLNTSGGEGRTSWLTVGGALQSYVHDDYSAKG